MEKDGRVSISQDLLGRKFTLDISDFTRLDQIDFVPSGPCAHLGSAGWVREELGVIKGMNYETK